MKNLFIYLFILFFQQLQALATVVTSVTDGSWTEATTWDNGVPTCGDTIYIYHLVEINENVDYSGCPNPMFIEVYGTLDFTTNGRRLYLPAGSGVDIKAPSGLLTGSGNGGGNSTFLSIGGVIMWRKSDGEIGPGSDFGSPLPIVLIEFNAVYNEDKVDIYWSTASELNNESFSVLRSEDGKEWEEIIKVDGAGNTSNITEYYDTDKNPLEGVSYYKLKQTDYNGDSEEFNVVPVENTHMSNVAFKIFPNPTTQDNINMNFEGFKDQEILVVLRDIQGREYFSKVQIIEADTEISVLPVDSELIPGVYLIVASCKDVFYSQKVVVK